MRLNVWSPLPPSPSGIADYAAEQLPLLARHAELTVVVEDPGAVDREAAGGLAIVAAGEAPAADLDLYQIGNSPSHAYVYRAALARPGVVLLHDWALHHLVLRETVGRGDRRAYMREMRRAYGEAGSFVGREIARGLGGDLLPALYPLNDRILDGALAVVGLTAYVVRRAQARLRGRPVLHLPHHVALGQDPPPSRDAARRALGLPADALIVTAPGLATVSKRLDVAIAAVARLRAAHPTLRLVVAGATDGPLPLQEWGRAAGLGEALLVTGRLSLDDFVRHLAAADVILALRFPSHGEISGALVRALGVGRPALVTAGTPAEEEFPEGVVVPVGPGPWERDEIVAALDHLLSHPSTRETLGQLAREHVSHHHALAPSVDRLAGFLATVAQRKLELGREVEARRLPEGTLGGYLRQEIRFGALDLGLPGPPQDAVDLIDALAEEGA